MFLKGLYTALVTPFNLQRQIDEQVLRQLLNIQISHGVNGIVLLGSTGEASTLTAYEKETVIKIGVDEVKGRTQLIIGTGSNSTAQTIENTLKAKEMGADAALVVTPYYNKPTQEGIFLHFKALTDTVDFPICVYNSPGRTGQNIQTETLKRIATLPNIISIKESSGNIEQASDIIEQVALIHPNFSVLSGDDNLTLPLMALGGHGVISVASNLIPGSMKDLFQALNKADYDTARSLHYRLAPFFRAIFLETNPIPIKAAMSLCGINAGSCRLPLCPLTPNNEKKLKIILDTLPQEWLLNGQT